eukprot:1963714-Amphidinium_carterae.1
MPGVIIAHAQMQGQEGVAEVTSATAVPEELLLEHDWWIRTEWKVAEARVMYEYLAQHVEAVTFMRGSVLDPNARPEVISLKKAAEAVGYDRDHLRKARDIQPGLLRGQSMWNFIIREEAMEKFRGYFRHEHMLGVQTTHDELDKYFCPAPYGDEVGFASHEYRVVYLNYKGVYSNQKGNWQWDSNEAKYGGSVMAKGFFFYWYGVIRMNGGKIEVPEFLKEAGATDRIIFVSTAPYPLGTL